MNSFYNQLILDQGKRNIIINNRQHFSNFIVKFNLILILIQIGFLINSLFFYFTLRITHKSQSVLFINKFIGFE